MKRAYFFIVTAIAVTWLAAIVCVAAGTNDAVSPSGEDIHTTIDSGVDVKRVPIVERGWNPGRAEQVEIKGLTAAVEQPNAATATVADPSFVETIGDMRMFAQNIVEEDKNIVLARVNPDVTEVDYAAPGKLFWIVPIKMTVSASVDKNGNVKVKLPWYNIFVKMAAKFDAWDVERELDEQTIISAPQDEFGRQAWTLQALAAALKKFVVGE